MQAQIRYEMNPNNFSKIPGSPIAYWASNSVVAAYKNLNLENVAQPRHGLATSDNDRFLKLWYEVDSNKTSIYGNNNFSPKWFPMNKGGAYRKWYGNNEWLINYENDGKELKDFAISIYRCSSRTIQNTQFYFKKGVTWSALTSGGFSVRFSKEGAIFGSGGYSAFTTEDKLLYILALMNNKVNKVFISLVSPTLNYEVGHIKTIPVILDSKRHDKIDEITSNNIGLSKSDWDSFETSWDFKKHPLI